MKYKYKALSLTLLLIFVIDIETSHSTKPCWPNSYFSNQELKLSDWIEKSDWAVKVEVTKIFHKFVPFLNCASKNQAKCKKHDKGTFKATILENNKGTFFEKNAEFVFTPGYCAKAPPSSLGSYIIYGFYKPDKKKSVYNGFHRSQH